MTDRCFQQHTNVEFLTFLKQVAKAYPRVQLHVVCDNYATHKHDNVKAWLVKNPRVHLHFTPTSGSWLNMVEIFFGIITRQAIRHGTFHSVADLEAAISSCIDGWNDRAHPFTWTKGADEIIAHAKPSPHQKKTYNTRHDTAHSATIAPVWAALLTGNAESQGHGSPSDEIRDPMGRVPNLWFGDVVEHETPRQRFHVEVYVAPEVAGQRIAAAVAAGGTVVDDSDAPSLTVIADQDGNRGVLCVAQPLMAKN